MIRNRHRSHNQVADRNSGCQEEHTPFGLVNGDSGFLHPSFGNSAKASDFIIDSPSARWKRRAIEEYSHVTHIQTKADSGPKAMVGTRSFSNGWSSLPITPPGGNETHVFPHGPS